MHAKPGYSLLELLVTMGIVAIVVTGGIPLMRQSIHSSRLSAEINAFVSGVQVARSEAIKRNAAAVLCPSVDGASCTLAPDAWEAGWLVFANDDRDSPPEIDPDEIILAYHSISKGLQVSANRPMFVFRSHAHRSTNGTVVFCPAQQPPEPRAVVISYTGRPRSARRRNDGRPYSCEH